jgi:hypothetical protein
MGHLLKIKCEDSRVNVHILTRPVYTHDGTIYKFSTNSQETYNSVAESSVSGTLRVRPFYSYSYQFVIIVNLLGLLKDTDM